MDIEKVRTILRATKASAGGGFGESIVLNLEVVTTWTDKERIVVEFSLPLMDELLNSSGTLHGAAATTIIDEITNIVTHVQDRVPRETSSVTLSTSFTSAAVAGEHLRILARCDKVGKSFAFAYAEIFVGNRLVASGKHSLFVFPRPLKID